jgi:hypothetical protein
LFLADDRMAAFHSKPSRMTTPEQQLAPPRKSAASPDPRGSIDKFSAALPRKISSRASQNGAAMLFDVGTVDIRRVGTQI